MDAGSFRAQRPEISDKAKGKSRRKKEIAFDKAKLKANKLMQQHKAMGHDHCFLDPVSFDEPFARIYWVPGALVPLFRLDVAVRRTCAICLDHHAPRRGWLCSESHYLCHGCFYALVQNAELPDALAGATDDDGNLKCPHPGCDIKFEARLLALQPHDASEIHVVDKLFAGIERLKLTAHERRVLPVALRAERERMQAEFDRIQQIADLDLRKAETIRLEVINEILTLRCPKKDCHMAFVEFEGCFALTCSNAACGAGFCAWCLADCGRDAHAHVAACPAAPLGMDGYFHSLAVFQEHHQKRKKRLVIQRLEQEEPDVRKCALKRLERELADLHIPITLAELGLK